MRNFHRFTRTGLSLFLALVLVLSLFTGCAGKTEEAEIILNGNLHVGGRDMLTSTYTVDYTSSAAPEADASSDTGSDADDPEQPATSGQPDEDDPMDTSSSTETSAPTSETDCGAKLIALTFDDGPVGETEAFIEELNKLDVDCTFFLLGYLIESYPDAVKAMVEGGHQIASHSYDHPNLKTSSQDKAYNQLMTTEKLLSEIDGKSNHYIRCPYGESGDYVKSIAPGPLIYWSLDSKDWQSRDADAVYNMIMTYAYDGCIILCHDIYGSTRAGALRAISDLKAAGYEFVTVEELLKRRGVDIQHGTTYYDAQNQGTNYPADAVTLTFGAYAESEQEPVYVLPEPAQ